MTQPQRRTVLFYPLNSAGHINSSVAIADRLREDYGFRTVFLVLGPTLKCITDHGHELVELEETAPFEDYEISDEENPDEPIDEELMRRKGKTKRKFLGSATWPQALIRYQKNLALEPLESFIRLIDLVGQITVSQVTQDHAQVERAIESIQPDLIVLDSFVPPPCIIRQEHTRPWIRLHSANPISVTKCKLPDGFMVPPHCGFSLFTREERDRMRREQPDRWQAILDEWKSAAHQLGQCMAKLNAPLKEFFHEQQCEARFVPGKMTIDSLHLNVYMYPEALDYDQEEDLFEYSSHWFRCNSLMRRPIGPTDSDEQQYWSRELETRLASGRFPQGMIYFSLGSIGSGNTRIMQRLIDMLKEDEQHLYVVSKGANGERIKLNSENMIGGNYLPQPFFLEHAKLAIIHGGNNSITECLYYGVPMIVLPLFADQFDNAQRVEDLNFGCRLHALKCTKEEMHQAIDKLTTSSGAALIRKERLRQIAQRMQSRDDTGLVVKILKKLAEDKRLDQDYLDECRKN